MRNLTILSFTAVWTVLVGTALANRTKNVTRTVPPSFNPSSLATFTGIFEPSTKPIPLPTPRPTKRIKPTSSPEDSLDTSDETGELESSSTPNPSPSPFITPRPTRRRKRPSMKPSVKPTTASSIEAPEASEETGESESLSDSVLDSVISISKSPSPTNDATLQPQPHTDSLDPTSGSTPTHSPSNEPSPEPQMHTLHPTSISSPASVLLTDRTQCGSDLVRQADYKGSISTTVDGDECQAWSVQYPWRHDYHPDSMVDYGLESNYCRNPDIDERPWCYTTNPEKEWAYCDIPFCSELQPEKEDRSTTIEMVKFVAMGDIPYKLSDRYCLNKQLRELDQQEMGFKFIVHVGDIKSGKDKCNEDRYKDIQEIIAHPYNAIGYDTRDWFMIPGDNEWSDCDDRVQAWQYWMTYFGNGNSTETGIGPNSKGFGTLSDVTEVSYFNQPLEEGNYPATSSNFAFFSDGVLFIGLNQVGGGAIGDEDKRVYGNFVWVEQNMNMYHSKGMRALVIFAQAAMTSSRRAYFGDPFMSLLRDQYPDVATLYIHGDDHTFGLSNPYPDNPNLIGLVLEEGKNADPLLISVNWDTASDEFLFDFDYRGGIYSSGCNANNTDKTWSSDYGS